MTNSRVTRKLQLIQGSIFRRNVVPTSILLFLFFIINATSLTAQSRFPFVVSGGVQAVTVPWYMKPIKYRLNPVLTVGTERIFKPGGSLQWLYTANIGILRNYWWMTGAFADVEIGFRHSLPLGFYDDMRLGAGYMHYFWRRETFELKDGKYVRAIDFGNPSGIVPLSIVLGYRGNSARPKKIIPFVSAQWIFHVLLKEEIPALTHVLILGGVRITLGQDKQTGRR